MAEAFKIVATEDLEAASGTFTPTFSPYGNAIPANYYGGHAFGGRKVFRN